MSQLVQLIFINLEQTNFIGAIFYYLILAAYLDSNDLIYRSLGYLLEFPFNGGSSHLFRFLCFILKNSLPKSEDDHVNLRTLAIARLVIIIICTYYFLRNMVSALPLLGLRVVALLDNMMLVLGRIVRRGFYLWIFLTVLFHFVPNANNTAPFLYEICQGCTKVLDTMWHWLFAAIFHLMHFNLPSLQEGFAPLQELWNEFLQWGTGLSF